MFCFAFFILFLSLRHDTFAADVLSSTVPYSNIMTEPTTSAVTTTMEPNPTTLAPTANATTLAPTTLAPTTLAPTTLAPTNATTLAPTTNATTLAPTTNATTLAPTTNATTLAPTTNATTLAPTTNATTLAPTTNATTLAPTTNATTPAPPPTTTPTPTLPTPSTGKYSIKPDVNSTACLMASFGLRISFNQGKDQEEVNLEPNVTTVTGTCGVNSSELILTSDKITMMFSFTHEIKNFRLHALNVTIKPASGVVFNAANTNLTLWQAAVGSSYMCNKQQTYNITDTLTFHTYELRVQPFGVKKGEFSTAEDCQADGESFLVPIAVGIALAVLIVIVLVAYFIGSKKSQATEECFLDSDLTFLVPIAVGVALSFLIILVLISYLIGRRKSRTGYQSV